MSERQEKGRRAPSWPISFAVMGKAAAALMLCQLPISGSCGPLRSVARLSWEVISRSATLAALSTRPITPAVTVRLSSRPKPPLPQTCPELVEGCQSLAKVRWLKKQTSELLPVGYFHLVFTLPHELNRLILANKKILLSLLFKAVSETLLEFGHTRLRGTLGIIAVLHILRLSSGSGTNLSKIISTSTASSPQALCPSIKAAGWRPEKSFSSPLKPYAGSFRESFSISLSMSWIEESSSLQVKGRHRRKCLRPCVKRTRWSMPKDLSPLHKKSSITWDAIPIGWPCPMTASSRSKTVRLPSASARG